MACSAGMLLVLPERRAAAAASAGQGLQLALVCRRTLASPQSGLSLRGSPVKGANKREQGDNGSGSQN